MAQATCRVSIKNYHLPFLDEYAAELGIDEDYTEIVNCLLLEFKRDRIRGCLASVSQQQPPSFPLSKKSPAEMTDEEMVDDLGAMLHTA